MYYQTSQVAKITGIHPNTVRFYEEMNLISSVPRKANGYRMFSKLHLEQIKLVRIALSTQVLSNNLRREAIEILKATARQEVEQAIFLAEKHIVHVVEEKQRAEEAISLIESIISGIITAGFTSPTLGRKNTALSLGISTDILRDWERNGLIDVPRSKEGHREYGSKELVRLKIIYILRQAHYSMMSILRMLHQLDRGNRDIRSSIDTPEAGEDILSATDHYLTALSDEEITSQKILDQLSVLILL